MNAGFPRWLAGALLASWLGVASAAAPAADAFLQGVDGVPLMPGLRQADADALVFDSPWGRVVEAYASGAVPRDRVLAFYAETLPQLGWSARGPAVYEREGETLLLEFPTSAAAGTTTLRISVKPADAPAP